MSMFHGKYLLLRHWWCGWVILGVISWVGYTTTTTAATTTVTCPTASGVDHLAFVHDALQRATVSVTLNVIKVIKQ